MIELLSPAGNYECLVAAVQAGCNAVFLSGKAFGARSYASNFDYEELKKSVEYCHLHKVKLQRGDKLFFIFDFKFDIFQGSRASIAGPVDQNDQTCLAGVAGPLIEGIAGSLGQSINDFTGKFDFLIFEQFISAGIHISAGNVLTDSGSLRNITGHLDTESNFVTLCALFNICDRRTDNFVVGQIGKILFGINRKKRMTELFPLGSGFVKVNDGIAFFDIFGKTAQSSVNSLDVFI